MPIQRSGIAGTHGKRKINFKETAKLFQSIFVLHILLTTLIHYHYGVTLTIILDFKFIFPDIFRTIQVFL